jgi:phosphatidate cytidylyltransferase
MFTKRFLTVLALLPGGAFVMFTGIANGLPLFFSLLLIALVISFEIFSLMEKRGYRFYLWVNSVSVTLSFITFYLYGLGVYDVGYFFVLQLGLLTVYCLMILIMESLSGNFESSMENIGISLFGYITLGIFCPIIGLVKMIDMSGYMLALLVGVTAFTDSGGLFVGKFFGRHKIPFLSSPNKTIEGYLGSVLFGFITALFFYFLQIVFSFSIFSLQKILIIAAVVIFSSIIGDLGESTLKRWAHTKDSGDLLPGHGGFFDRFDSMIFSAPAFYVLIKLMGY